MLAARRSVVCTVWIAALLHSVVAVAANGYNDPKHPVSRCASAARLEDCREPPHDPNPEVRQCSLHELASSVCCNTGCLLDARLGWVSDAYSARTCTGAVGEYTVYQYPSVVACPPKSLQRESGCSTRPSFCGDLTIKRSHVRRSGVVQFHGEFGYEIDGVIPHAYFLHTRGDLTLTRSVAGMEPFYYFSPRHEPLNRTRTNQGNFQRYQLYLGSHQGILPSVMVTPPYAQVFRNSRFVFAKPTLVVHNKAEAGELVLPPGLLRALFDMLSLRYQVVYVRPQHGDVRHGFSHDGASTSSREPVSKPAEDRGITKLHPQVLDFQNMVRQSNDLPESTRYNEVLLRVHANAKHFISVQGGSARLASMFGGTNLILHHIGAAHEMRYHSYQHYGAFSNCSVIVAFKRTELQAQARRLFA